MIQPQVPLRLPCYDFTPVADLTVVGCPLTVGAPPSGGTCTGAAWLSSARVVRCRVKSHNERNPCFQLPASQVGDSGKTAGVKPEEGGDDVKSSWPLCPGLHTCYNGTHRGRRVREEEQIPKKVPQFRLQAATRLHEDGVASNRRSAYCGEYVPGPCTHRPSHHGSWLYPKVVR